MHIDPLNSNHDSKSNSADKRDLKSDEDDWEVILLLASIASMPAQVYSARPTICQHSSHVIRKSNHGEYETDRIASGINIIIDYVAGTLDTSSTPSFEIQYRLHD